MVVKIQNSYPSMRHTLNYNEDKVSSKEAERIAVFNIEQNDIRIIKETFDKYERWNIRSQDVSFQMSINPNNENGERLSNEKATEIAFRIMAELGYKNQPIIVYKHNDIEREHFHIVSIRTNEKGKKIRDRQEQNRLQRFLKTLEKEYGFKVGKENEISEKIVNPQEQHERQKSITSTIDKSLSQQYIEAFEHAKKYHFRTFTQFKAIMQWYGINVTKNEYNRQDVLCFQKIDKSGTGCSPLMRQHELERDMISEMLEKIEECKADKGRYLPERRKIADIITKCIQESDTVDELKSKLEEKKIGLLISRNKDGNIFGLTVVDHQSMMAFKSSDVNRDLNPELLNRLEARTEMVGMDERKIENSDSLSDHLSYMRQQKDISDTVFETAGELIELMTSGGGMGTSDAQRKSDSDAQRPRKNKKKKFKY